MKSCHSSFYSLSIIQLLLFFTLMNKQWLKVNSLSNETDHLALLKFKQGITNDPFGVLNSWNDSLPFCNWTGITCEVGHQRVMIMELKGQNLFGNISPYIGNLSFLRTLDLQNNSLGGEVPVEVGKLFRLQQFQINNNSLEGEIPTGLTNISELRRIDLTYNNFLGEIPEQLGSLPNLQMLSLGANNLTGEIPASLGNLSSLLEFSVAVNNLVGTIPEDIGRITRLARFSVALNQLSGIFPPSIYNISSISIFSIPSNKLEGSLPDNIGLTFPNLTFFSIGLNEFSGPIPSSLANASKLSVIDIGNNHFVGQVPTNLGNLRALRWLRLSNNSLGSNSANDLDFLASLRNCSNLEVLYTTANNFGGVFASSIANLSSRLTAFDMGSNRITGTITGALENLVNLSLLSLEYNLLTGEIPSYFGKFQKLEGFSVAGNILSGQIPTSLGNLVRLLEIDLHDNNFVGSIPPSLANCNNMYLLDLSKNNLTGSIPQQILLLPSLSRSADFSGNSLTGILPEEVGKLTAINTLDVSENKFTGEIPSSIGDCLSLEHLFMQGNAFQGSIPSSLASAKGLKEIDLSRNQLTGKIPENLQDMPYLQYVNLSFNNLEGEMPTGGIFGNASALSLIGNTNICGGVPELGLPKCATTTRKANSHAVTLRNVLIPVISGILLLSLVLTLSWIRKSKKKQPSESADIINLVKVSYKDLYDATGGFSPSNFIGSGSFGSVYKGFLHQVGGEVAVKVLNLQKEGASKSFMAECRALRNIRHQNLVKILTSCAGLDYKGNEFKALVFAYMKNGSLEKWLHTNGGTQNPYGILKLFDRLNIAINVASALYYLHDLCESPVIHCDLKPSNVLLDENMVARVTDFGSARLVSAIAGSTRSQFSTIGIKGTIGYAAPEYGMGSEVSKEGDVYSFGILLLELFSGKRPTSETFPDGFNLHSYVKSSVPERIEQVVDSTLLCRDLEEAALSMQGGEIQEEGQTSNQNLPNLKDTKECKCLVSVLEIGIKCSSESPRERMSMRDVIKELHWIKEAFIET